MPAASVIIITTMKRKATTLTLTKLPTKEMRWMITKDLPEVAPSAILETKVPLDAAATEAAEGTVVVETRAVADLTMRETVVAEEVAMPAGQIDPIKEAIVTTEVIVTTEAQRLMLKEAIRHEKVRKRSFMLIVRRRKVSGPRDPRRTSNRSSVRRRSGQRWLELASQQLYMKLLCLSLSLTIEVFTC